MLSIASMKRKSWWEQLFGQAKLTTCAYRRKSDIENERLPPELVDPEDVAPHLSSPGTPADDIKAVPSPNGIKAAIEAAVANGSISHPAGVPPADSTSTPMSPVSPSSGMMASPSAFRRGHGRAASLGTTMTSPSTRRRSIESTISLIKEAVDGTQGENELTDLADQLSSPAKEKPSTPIGTGGGSGVKPGERWWWILLRPCQSQDLADDRWRFALLCRCSSSIVYLWPDDCSFFSLRFLVHLTSRGIIPMFL